MRGSCRIEPGNPHERAEIPCWNEHPGQIGLACAIGERRIAALAHAGNDDPAGAAALQPADRAVDLGQAVEKRAVMICRGWFASAAERARLTHQ
jgi:hypothetical protein